MSPNPPQEGLHEHIETIAENAERDITTSRRTQDHLRHVGGILLIIYAIQLSLFGILAWLAVSSCLSGEPNRYYNHTRISGESCDLVEVKHGCC